VLALGYKFPIKNAHLPARIISRSAHLHNAPRKELLH
jgi:hypothetical protein